MLKIIIEKMLTVIGLYNACIKLDNTDAAYIHLGQYTMLRDILTAAGYQIDVKSEQTNNKNYLFTDITITYKTEQEKDELMSLDFEIKNDTANYKYKNNQNP